MRRIFLLGLLISVMSVSATSAQTYRWIGQSFRCSYMISIGTRLGGWMWLQKSMYLRSKTCPTTKVNS